MGFEPTTFPVSPGRAHQTLDHCPIFPIFEFAFPSHRCATRGVFFLEDQLPGATVLQGFRVIRVVVSEAFFDVNGLANIVAIRGLALEDVNVEGHKQESLVEPMGFEPTTSSMPSRRAPNCATAPPGRLSDVSIRALASSMRVPQSVVVSASNISGESHEFSKSNKCVNLTENSSAMCRTSYQHCLSL